MLEENWYEDKKKCKLQHRQYTLYFNGFLIIDFEKC